MLNIKNIFFSKKHLFTLLYLFATLCLVGILYITVFSPFMSKKHFRIAIIFYTDAPLNQSIRKGLLDTLDKRGIKYTPTIYDCNGNKNLIRSHIEDAIDQKHDLLFTSGISVTTYAKEITNKKQINIPIVFSGIAQPEDYNLIASRESSGNNLTGVAFDIDKYYDLATRITVLFEVRPNMQKVVIPFSDDAEYLYNEAVSLEKEILKQSKQRGISTTTVKLPIKTVGETIEKLKPFNDTDAIILLRDRILASLTGIIKFCSLHGITLYTSELESVRSGAAIGYGQEEYNTGAACADLIYKILIHKEKPSNLPVTSFFNTEIHMNAATKDLQGLASFDRKHAKHPLLQNARFV